LELIIFVLWVIEDVLIVIHLIAFVILFSLIVIHNPFEIIVKIEILVILEVEILQWALPRLVNHLLNIANIDLWLLIFCKELINLLIMLSQVGIVHIKIVEVLSHDIHIEIVVKCKLVVTVIILL
jgi:hypothetical protein